jgi:hypothetical protein
MDVATDFAQQQVTPNVAQGSAMPGMRSSGDTSDNTHTTRLVESFDDLNNDELQILKR